jgi:hypothetical protein
MSIRHPGDTRRLAAKSRKPRVLRKDLRWIDWDCASAYQQQAAIKQQNATDATP